MGSHQMSFSWVQSAENEVIRLKNSIIAQEKRLEATREKLKLAEQVLADRRDRFKDKKDYDGEPYVK
jgi:hypothetical protein